MILIYCDGLFGDNAFVIPDRGDPDYHTQVADLFEDVTEVKFVKATGADLVAILEAYVGIPAPRVPDLEVGFMWSDMFAKTIVANMLNMYEAGRSFILEHPEDTNDTDGEVS